MGRCFGFDPGWIRNGVDPGGADLFRYSGLAFFMEYTEYTNVVSCFLGPVTNLLNQLPTVIEPRSLILRC